MKLNKPARPFVLQKILKNVSLKSIREDLGNIKPNLKPVSFQLLQVANPCSKHSWQLIQWPGDKQCYRIFDQGPCPHSQELAFNAVTGLAECRCPKNLLFWSATNRCYAEFSRGPCEVNQVYFNRF